jgi:ubiquinone/menaquinone biosynthesis C-methylase UbiE
MVDLETVKKAQQQVWSVGSYSTTSWQINIVSEQLMETLDLRAVQKVLDVATGNGNTALAAARRFCDVSAVDYVPYLLELGRQRAAAEQLNINFVEGDAENLPFPDSSFDVVVSTFGVMFAPDQEKAASELIRVCRPGGKIGLANWWGVGSLTEKMFHALGKFSPPSPAGLKPPLLWGTEERIRELFGDAVASLHINRRSVSTLYKSADHMFDISISTYGPAVKTYEALDEPGKQMMREAMIEVVNANNISGDDTVKLISEYAEVVAVKK